MRDLYWWGFTTGEERTEEAQDDEKAALVPDAAFIPKGKDSEPHRGPYRWTGPERLWLAAPEKPSPKR